MRRRPPAKPKAPLGTRWTARDRREVCLEGLVHVKQPVVRQGLGYGVRRSKAITSNRLGHYGDSTEAYERSV